LSVFFGVESRSQILSPGLGDIVDYGKGLWYQPASLFSLAGQYDNPMPQYDNPKPSVDYIHQSGTKNLPSGLQGRQ